DLIVTGVQTCALPISAVVSNRRWTSAGTWQVAHARPVDPRARKNGCSAVTPPPADSVIATPSVLGAATRAVRYSGPAPAVERRRSEERRVGKEWRCRG